ncbi:MAG: TRAP transporter large permease subunit [Deltaproteobacteria bacterium]|nr:TRAP transporter large permease subunit [Deltaproteobacteria bacterium]
MSPEQIGWLGLGGMLFLLALRVPVAFAMALVGFLGYAAVSGMTAAYKVVGMVPYTAIATYGFSVVPLFLIMGSFLSRAGLVSDLFQMARLWVGNIPGGLVHATIVAGSLFAAASGSGLAATTVLATVCVPEMRKGGVDKVLACGTAACVGPIDQMIPPSILMVIYCIITGASLGKLLIAGILPGVLLAFGFMVLTYIRVRRNPTLAPLLGEKVSWRQRFISLKNIWGILVLAILVLGGIYTGIFTPIEAGAIGACGAFFLAIATRGQNWSELATSLLDAAKVTGMIFLIIASAFIFGYFLAITRIPSNVSEFIVGLAVSPIWVLIGVMIMYLIIGCFVDMVAALFITLPVIFPAMMKLGFDPIWFGVLIVMQCEIALISPPFGLALFIVKGVVKDVTLGEVIRGISPFFIVDLIVLALYITFPEIALFLPRTMMGK